MNAMTSGILVVLVAAAVSAGGFLLVSRYIPNRWLVADGDAASALYATIGMVYAILIAIAAIAVWEPRAAVSQGTSDEASNLVEAYWSANSLAADDRNDIQRLITGYLREAEGREWTTLTEQMKPAPQTEAKFVELRERVDSAAPETERELAAHALLSSQISAAASSRRARIAAASEGMPGLLWPVLIAGSLISVVFLYMFGLSRTFPNGLMMAVVGGMIALLLFVIYQVEYPYSRAFAIDPGSLSDALIQLRSASG
jgi:hypothetical protein